MDSSYEAKKSKYRYFYLDIVSMSQRGIGTRCPMMQKVPPMAVVVRCAVTVIPATHPDGHNEWRSPLNPATGSTLPPAHTCCGASGEVSQDIRVVCATLSPDNMTTRLGILDVQTVHFRAPKQASWNSNIMLKCPHTPMWGQWNLTGGSRSVHTFTHKSQSHEVGYFTFGAYFETNFLCLYFVFPYSSHLKPRCRSF